MEKYDEALSILYQARKIRETGTGNRLIGHILLQVGKLDQAIPYLETARIMLPNDLLLMQDLGLAYIKTGRVQEGTTLLAQLRRAHPQNLKN
jgi:predicted Zn-dependent protease